MADESSDQATSGTEYHPSSACEYLSDQSINFEDLVPRHRRPAHRNPARRIPRPAAALKEGPQGVRNMSAKGAFHPTPLLANLRPIRRRYPRRPAATFPTLPERGIIMTPREYYEYARTVPPDPKQRLRCCSRPDSSCSHRLDLLFASTLESWLDSFPLGEDLYRFIVVPNQRFWRLYEKQRLDSLELPSEAFPQTWNKEKHEWETIESQLPRMYRIAPNQIILFANATSPSHYRTWSGVTSPALLGRIRVALAGMPGAKREALEEYFRLVDQGHRKLREFVHLTIASFEEDPTAVLDRSYLDLLDAFSDGNAKGAQSTTVGPTKPEVGHGFSQGSALLARASSKPFEARLRSRGIDLSSKRVAELYALLQETTAEVNRQTGVIVGALMRIVLLPVELEALEARHHVHGTLTGGDPSNIFTATLQINHSPLSVPAPSVDTPSSGAGAAAGSQSSPSAGAASAPPSPAERDHLTATIGIRFGCPHSDHGDDVLGWTVLLDLSKLPPGSHPGAFFDLRTGTYCEFACNDPRIYFFPGIAPHVGSSPRLPPAQYSDPSWRGSTRTVGVAYPPSIAYRPGPPLATDLTSLYTHIDLALSTPTSAPPLLALGEGAASFGSPANVAYTLTLLHAQREVRRLVREHLLRRVDRRLPHRPTSRELEAWSAWAVQSGALDDAVAHAEAVESWIALVHRLAREHELRDGALVDSLVGTAHPFPAPGSPTRLALRSLEEQHDLAVSMHLPAHSLHELGHEYLAQRGFDKVKLPGGAQTYARARADVLPPIPPVFFQCNLDLVSPLYDTSALSTPPLPPLFVDSVAPDAAQLLGAHAKARALSWELASRWAAGFEVRQRRWLIDEGARRSVFRAFLDEHAGVVTSCEIHAHVGPFPSPPMAVAAQARYSHVEPDAAPPSDDEGFFLDNDGSTLPQGSAGLDAPCLSSLLQPVPPTASIPPPVRPLSVRDDTGRRPLAETAAETVADCNDADDEDEPDAGSDNPVDESDAEGARDEADDVADHVAASATHRAVPAPTVGKRTRATAQLSDSRPPVPKRPRDGAHPEKRGRARAPVLARTGRRGTGRACSSGRGAHDTSASGHASDTRSAETGGTSGEDADHGPDADGEASDLRCSVTGNNSDAQCRRQEPADERVECQQDEGNSLDNAVADSGCEEPEPVGSDPSPPTGDTARGSAPSICALARAGPNAAPPRFDLVAKQPPAPALETADQPQQQQHDVADPPNARTPMQAGRLVARLTPVLLADLALVDAATACPPAQPIPSPSSTAFLQTLGASPASASTSPLALGLQLAHAASDRASLVRDAAQAQSFALRGQLHMAIADARLGEFLSQELAPAVRTDVAITHWVELLDGAPPACDTWAGAKFALARIVRDGSYDGASAGEARGLALVQQLGTGSNRERLAITQTARGTAPDHPAFAVHMEHQLFRFLVANAFAPPDLLVPADAPRQESVEAVDVGVIAASTVRWLDELLKTSFLASLVVSALGSAIPCLTPTYADLLARPQRYTHADAREGEGRWGRAASLVDPRALPAWRHGLYAMASSAELQGAISAARARLSADIAALADINLDLPLAFPPLARHLPTRALRTPGVWGDFVASLAVNDGATTSATFLATPAVPPFAPVPRFPLAPGADRKRRVARDDMRRAAYRGNVADEQAWYSFFMREWAVAYGMLEDDADVWCSPSHRPKLREFREHLQSNPDKFSPFREHIPARRLFDFAAETPVEQRIASLALVRGALAGASPDIMAEIRAARPNGWSSAADWQAWLTEEPWATRLAQRQLGHNKAYGSPIAALTHSNGGPYFRSAPLLAVTLESRPSFRSVLQLVGKRTKASQARVGNWPGLGGDLIGYLFLADLHYEGLLAAPTSEDVHAQVTQIHAGGLKGLLNLGLEQAYGGSAFPAMVRVWNAPPHEGGPPRAFSEAAERLGILRDAVMVEHAFCKYGRAGNDSFRGEAFWRAAPSFFHLGAPIWTTAASAVADPLPDEVVIQ